jgi:ComF family protein
MPVLAIGAYAQPLRSLILAKSHSNRAVSYQLGKLVWELSYIRNAEFDIIVPVPLHWTRYAWRGYNQAHVMAEVISEKTGKPIISLLKRMKRTPYQSEVKGVQRIQNVKDIFMLTKHYQEHANKKILLVDDLMTTGATLQSAAKKLMRLKPEKLTAIVAARVI